MNDVIFMEMTQSVNDLNGVEYDALFRELLLFILLLELIKLSSLNKRHYKVKNIWGLEHPFHLN